MATPKQIRELMQVDGLTNDEVKSHLQVRPNFPICVFVVWDKMREKTFCCCCFVHEAFSRRYVIRPHFFHKNSMAFRDFHHL